MCGFVLHGKEDLRYNELPPPNAKPGQVLVNVRRVGICGSDVHYFSHGRVGNFIPKRPFALGHEFAGEVAEIAGVFHEVDETDAIRAVHTALDLGINYFDIAPAYGGTRSETVLGKALRGIPRDHFFLPTIIGKYTNPEKYGDVTLWAAEPYDPELVAQVRQILTPLTHIKWF